MEDQTFSFHVWLMFSEIPLRHTCTNLLLPYAWLSKLRDYAHIVYLSVDLRHFVSKSFPGRMVAHHCRRLAAFFWMPFFDPELDRDNLYSVSKVKCPLWRNVFVARTRESSFSIRPSFYSAWANVCDECVKAFELPLYNLLERIASIPQFQTSAATIIRGCS